MYFVDSDNGWLTLAGNFVGFRASDLFETSDGAKTWRPIHCDASDSEDAVSCYYNKPFSRLIVADVERLAGARIRSTTDEGASWSFQPTWGMVEGMYFIDSLHGAASTNASFLLTSDGGVTWNEHRWTPGGMTPLGFSRQGKRCYLTADFNATSNIYLTSDDGQTWDSLWQPPNIPGTQFPDPETGVLQMDESGMIYLQTHYHGFYESPDSGVNWTPICGPSGATAVDNTTYFSVDEGTILVADTGGIWRYSPPPYVLTSSARAMQVSSGGELQLSITSGRYKMESVDSVEFNLYYDQNLLAFESGTLAGWNVALRPIMAGVTLVHLTPINKPSGTTLPMDLRLHFRTFLTTVDSSTIYTSPTSSIGAPGDWTCSSQRYGDSIVVHVGTACGDDLIRKEMKGELSLRDLRVQPDTRGFISVRFRSSSVSSDSHIRIIDALGVTRKEFDRSSLQPGSHSMLLDASDLSSGVYVLSVSGDGAFVSTRFQYIR